MKLNLVLNRGFFPLRKCAADWGAIASAAATTIGNIATLEQQQKADHNARVLARWQTNQNINLAHEQMAAQRKMYEDSVAEQRYIDERNRRWQLADTESERNWNSASAVAQRFRDAGINPYLAMTQGAAGNMAGGSAGSPSMPSGSAPSGSIGASPNVAVSPAYHQVYDIGRGISDAVANFFNAMSVSSKSRLDNSQAALNEADALTRLEENQAKISSLLQSKDLQHWQEKGLRQSYALNDEIKSAIIGKHREEYNLLRLQQDEIAQSMLYRGLEYNLKQDETLSRLALNDTQIQELSANIGEIVARTDNVRQTTSEIKKNGLVDRWLKRLGIHAQKQQIQLIEKQLPYLINKARKESLLETPFSKWFGAPVYTEIGGSAVSDLWNK